MKTTCYGLTTLSFAALLLAPTAGFGVARKISSQSVSGFGQDNNASSWMLGASVVTPSGITVSQMTTCPGSPEGNTTNTCPDGNYLFLFQVLSAPEDLTITFSSIQELSNQNDTNGNLIVFETCSSQTTLALCTPPSILGGLSDVYYTTGGTTGNMTLSIMFGQGGTGSFFPQGGLTFFVDEQLAEGAGVPQTPAVTVSGNSGVSLSSTSLTFGSQQPDTSSGILNGAGNPLQTVTLTNGGLTDLHVFSVAAPAQFSAASNCMSSSPIAPGSSCSITAGFAPTGSSYGTTPPGTDITVTDDAPSGAQTIAVSGTTDPSPTTLAPGALGFGTEPIGTDGFQTNPSPSQPVTVTNTSLTDTIQITAVTPDSSGNFCSDIASQACNTSQSSTCFIGIELSPVQDGVASSCMIQVSAVVAPMGPVTGTLSVSDTDLTTQQPENPHIVALTGSGGTDGLNLDPASFAFTSAQAVGTTSAPQEVSLSIADGLSIPPTEQVNGAIGSPGFILNASSNCASGGSVNCAVNVEFSPVFPGFQAGSVSIAENVGTGTEVATLSGTATGAGINLSPSSVAFPPQTVNTSSGTMPVTITNTGNESLNINSIISSANFAETNTCGTGLAVGASCTISISFAPAVVGPLTGSVSISDNAYGSPQTITLSGTGIAPLAESPTLTVDFYGDGEGEPAMYRPSDGTWYVHTNSDSGTSGNLTQQWGLPGDIPVPGDYQGVGKDDFALFRPSNATWYIIPTAGGSAITQQWGETDDLPVPADYDGDGKTDIAVWRPSNGTWYILPSDGSPEIIKLWGLTGDVPAVGDYDGDGKADYAVWRPSNGTWYVVLSSTGQSVTTQFGSSGDMPAEGDYDGDGKTDYAVWRPSNGTWYIILSSTGQTVTVQWGLTGDIPVVGDYNGDGKNDYAVFRPSNATWYFEYSSGGSATTQWGLTGDVPATHLPSMIHRDKHIANFDGDRKADIGVFQPSNGAWSVIDSSTGKSVTQQFGLNGDIIVPGDYDGDGKTDYAVWRPLTQTWYVDYSTTGKTVTERWGLVGDIPVPGDYDGDGKTDYAVWRPSTGTWWVILSSTGKSVSQQWGARGDIPVPADYDGDGRTDYAIFRPSTGTWWVMLSSTGKTVSQQWGENGDIPVPGDYDGDTKADFTVFRPSNGTWYTLQSSNGKAVTTQFGLTGDIPVAKDYDGDEKADIAVFRPSNATWYILQSSNGKLTTTEWGLSTDVPVSQPTGQ
jgi:hypothetical protein